MDTGSIEACREMESLKSDATALAGYALKMTSQMHLINSFTTKTVPVSKLVLDRRPTPPKKIS